MSWWWMIVFAAQMTWKEHKPSIAPVVTYIRADSNTFDARITELKINNLSCGSRDIATKSDSLVTYAPNETYVFKTV